MTSTFSPGSLSFGRCRLVTGSPVRLLGTQRGGSWRCMPAARQQRACSRGMGPVCMAADLQFIRGVNEPTVPDVKLTRSRDGSSGTATFVFQDPSVFEASGEMGDITGLYMLDEEGTITTVDVQAKFVNGKPDRIEAKYVMKNSFEWERFMRFMERYAQEKELGFTKKRVLTAVAYQLLNEFGAAGVYNLTVGAELGAIGGAAVGIVLAAPSA